jgi:hypothetical protein
MTEGKMHPREQRALLDTPWLEGQPVIRVCGYCDQSKSGTMASTSAWWAKHVATKKHAKAELRFKKRVKR